MTKLEVGKMSSFTKTISETDVYMFAGISGDLNPMHIDDEYAKKTPFRNRIVHGCLVNGLISTVIGMKLPGPGTIYMSQNSSFIKPVYINDTITAKVKVIECLKEEKGIYKLETNVFNQDNDLVLKGEAVVKYTKEEVEDD